ncbi:PAS domain-containing protein [uncultured Hymenobacter sp.]|uniref:PAS domain-containing protein n=1 Tax=uncultured Hymenobacter sp. TaxID=170016 RepID=UPI0035CBDAA3
MLSPAAAAIASAPDLLRDLLAVSLTGIIFYTPLYDPSGSGEIVDFTFEYLNPTAQRMMAMPEVPTVTHNQQWPHSIAHGTFQFHVEAFVSGEPREYNVNYQADGYDNYYRLAARRSGHGLLVNFTDTADQPRSPVEEALRTAQAAEKAARADAEEQRAALGRAFEQAPVSIAILRGPEFVVELANPSLGLLWGRPVGPALGRPLFEALPDLAGQGLEELLTQALRTGEPLYFQERPTWLARDPADPPVLGYYNFTYQPLHDAQGHVTGLITVGLDVTEQVLARQQVQQLNQELEARVQARTREALALQADLLAAAQRQAREREQFYEIFAQTPAAICVQRGPEHRYEYANPAYQDFFPGRELVGRSVAEALPETVASGVVALLDRVYETGETYFGEELPLLVARPDGQPPEQMYFTFTYQALRENGQIVGISTFAYNVAAQVQARRQREAERQQLLHLFTEAPAGIAILAGPELVFEFVNPGYQQLFPDRTLRDQSVFAALPEIVGTPVEDVLRHVYATGDPHEEQGLRIPFARAADGVLEDRYFTFTYQGRRDERGQVTGILVFSFEVTEQVQALQRVEESREELQRYQFMADQARDPFILMRADGSFAYLNQRALHTWGYSADEIAHLRVPDLDPIYDEHAFRQLFAQAQHETIPLFETLHRRKDGHVYPVEASATGLRFDGQPHLLVVARDITVQKRFVAALQESEARFRTMADAAPNLVWAVHPDSSIRYINRAFLDFVGLNHEQQYLDTGWQPYLHPDELELTQRTLTHAIAERLPYVLEHRLRRHDGQYRWLLAQGAPSYLAGGELYGYVGSAIDITDLKQANEQLHRTNVDLDNFIYTASHDLKQPIANIEGLLQGVQHALPPAGRVGEVSRMLDLMQDAVERFGRTITHLTDISRLQHEYDQPAALVPLARVVQEVRLDLAPLVTQTHARVAVQVPAEATLHFSEKNLRSVVYNLLSNALKYHHPDRAPEVTLTYEAQAAHHVLAVRDNGLGLDVAQDQDKLFGMFKRLHSHVEGSGIGLYMVKKVVENAGGRIEVESTLGQGSVFRVYLPH